MKRLISWVLALVMLLSMVPATAFLAVEASAAGTSAYTYVQQKPVSIASSDTGTVGAWYNNGSTFVTDEGSANYVEIVEDGCKDAGAMHVYQDNVANNNMSLGMFVGGQAAGTYTLKLSVKGDLGLSGQTCKFYPYGCADQAANLHDTLGTTDVADWTEVTIENIAVASDFYYLIFDFSKYNWQTDMYIDNVQLINASGVDVLAGAGNFYTLEEVSTDSATTNQWPDASMLDTANISSAYSSYTGAWTPMYPEGAANSSTWNAWNDVHYGEIAADGYKDAGSLHLLSVSGSNTGVAIDAGMTSGETYTLGFYAKGTVNTGKVLGMYANGDGTIISDTASFGAGWNYYTHTFTANQSQINLVAADWGSVDIYIDNITLVNSAGVDLLSGYGDFYIYKEVFKLYDSDPGESYKWYNGTGYTVSDGMYIELVEEGADDDGALHIYQTDGVVAAEDMRLHIRTGTIPVGTYTLQYNIKGSDLGVTTTNDACRFYLDKNSDLTTQFRNLAGAKTVNDWTALSETITTTTETSYVVLGISKYVCGIDCYVDNVKLLDENGKDLLRGAGNFVYYEPITIAASNPDTNYEWFNHNGYVNNDTKRLEIVSEGANDAGSVHVYQPDGQTADADMLMGIRVDCVPTGTYTLRYNIKGTDLGNTDGNSNKFYLHQNSDLTNQFRVAAGAKTLEDWTTVSETFTTTSDVYYIYLMVSKYVNGADYYVDNVQLLDADGNDMLCGAGNFCVAPVSEPEPEPDPEPDPEPEGPNVPTDDVVSGTADVLDTSRHSWERLSHTDAWTPFFPTGINADTNWAAWETKSENETGYNYAEIAAIGKSDAGSLHFVRGDVYENVGVAIDAGMTIGQTYTLKAYVKGYAKATYGGLQLYGNGDGMIATFGADGTVANNTGWTEVTHTFTANRATLEMLVGGGAYLVDIYVDDLQLLDKNGSNILGDAGNFSVTEKTIPDLAVISSNGPERILRWYWNTDATSGVTYSSSVNNGLQVIETGCEDPGALYIWQNQQSQDIYMGLLNAMASDLENNQTYTLSFNVKGVFCNEEGLGVYPAYLSQEVVGNSGDMNIQKKLLAAGYSYNANGQIVVTDWTNLTFELPYNSGENGFMYLNLFMSKYTHGSRFYLDNVKVLDPNGNDMLCGAGNFMDSGSESYPILLPKEGATIYNSNTMYYMVYCDSASVSISNHVESGVTAGDQNFSVTYNGTTKAASSKNVTMNMASQKDGMPIVFSVTSTEGSIDIPEGTLETIQRAGEFNIYDITFSGYSTATETLTLGSQELGFFWGDSDGYSYTYTPAVKGTLTVTLDSITNGTAANITLSTADSSASMADGTVSLLVDAGEAVTVSIASVADKLYGYPATNLAVTSGFAEYACQHSWGEGTVTTAPGCESEGVRTYTCSGCGETKTEPVPASGHTEVIDPAVAATLSTAGKTEGKHCSVCSTVLVEQVQTDPLMSTEWSMTLSDDLSVNFYIDVDDSVAANTKITVSFNGAENVYAVGDEISVKVAAAQMNDTITVTVVNGDDSVTNTYTVKQYAEDILADADQSQYHDMVQAMLNYGGAAQTYFGYNPGNLVSSELGEEAVPATTDAMSVSGSAEGIKYYGASLVYRDKIAVRLYFSGSSEGITFMVGEKEYEAVTKDGMCYVEIADILPQKLDQQITLTAADASGNTLTVTYGPMNYIVRMNAKGSENLQNLMKALYNYHLAAKALAQA